MKIVKIILWMLMLVVAWSERVIAVNNKPVAPCDDSTQLPCDVSIILPPECKDYAILKGNPLTARTVLFGGRHSRGGGVRGDDTPCDEAKISCATALAKKRRVAKRKTVALFEGYSYGTLFSCDKEKAQNLAQTCGGWNMPRGVDRDRDAMIQAKMRGEALKGLIFSIESIERSGKSIAQQRAELIKILNDSLKRYSSEIMKLEKISLADDPLKENTVDFSEIKIAAIKTLLQKVPLSNNLRSLLDDLMYTHSKSMTEYSKHLKNRATTIGKPNRYLALSVREAASSNELVFAFAGNAHVDKDASSITEDIAEEHRATVQKLYDELDAGTSALSCTL